MNVAFVVTTDYPWRSGGVNQALHNLVSYLATRGHDIDVYAIENFSGAAEPIFRAVDGVSLQPVSAPLLGLRDVPVIGGVATLATVLRLPGRMLGSVSRSRRSPDVLVADFSAARAALAWGERAGVPVVVLRWAHWADELSRTGRLFGLLGGYWRRREASVFARARCVVVDGPDLVDDAVTRGVEAGRVCLVPSSVDVDRFASAQPGLGVAADVVGDRRVVLFPSMLRDIKGFDHLLRAFALMPADAREGAVIVATGRENQAPYRELARDLGIESSVVFLGEVAAADLPGLFSAADVAVFPYLFGAGYSLAGIEAMAAGLPLVAYDVQAFSAIVEDGVTGALVPVRDEAALAAALTTMLSDDSARARMGAEAQRRARKFDVASVGARFEGVLMRLKAGDAPCG